jgi:hypothetical protein
MVVAGKTSSKPIGQPLGRVGWNLGQEMKLSSTGAILSSEKLNDLTHSAHPDYLG